MSPVRRDERSADIGAGKPLTRPDDIAASMAIQRDNSDDRLAAAAQSALEGNDKRAPEIDGEIFSLEVLRTLARDTQGVPLQQMIGVFIAELRDRTRRLIEAATTMDVETICRESHALQSSAATFGAIRAAQIARMLNQAGRQNQQCLLPALVEELRSCAEPTILALRGVEIA